MKNQNELQVIIVEDHSSYREGLRQLLLASNGFCCVGAFGSLEAALKKLPEADVVLLDINLPGKSGIEGIPLIKSVSNKMKIIMLTVFDSDDNIFNAILAGADGYILKKTAPARILTSIEEVIEGGTPMTPYVARRVIEHFKQLTPHSEAEYDLTSREREILAELVNGFDNKQIADNLFISYETVRNHVKHIYEKLHVSSRSQAVLKAIHEGLTK